jgi:hypothetical protein
MFNNLENSSSYFDFKIMFQIFIFIAIPLNIEFFPIIF